MPIDETDCLKALLEEYKCIRHEIEIRTDATKAYGWPVIVSSVAIIAAAGRFGDSNTLLEIFPILMPLIGMTILALDANATFAMDKARISLVNIEERIASLNDNLPVLSTEKDRLTTWSKPGRQDDFERKTMVAAGGYLVWFVFVSLIRVFSCEVPENGQVIRECISVDSDAAVFGLTVAIVYVTPLLLFWVNRSNIYVTRYQ